MIILFIMTRETWLILIMHKKLCLPLDLLSKDLSVTVEVFVQPTGHALINTITEGAIECAPVKVDWAGLVDWSF